MENQEYIQSELRNYLTDVPKKYRDGNYLFAYFASFATVFSPDMLYQLWLNFKEYHKNNQLQKIHIVAISDLLQSNLCYKIGYELYEMEEGIAQYLQNINPEELIEKRQIKISSNTKYKLATFTVEFSKKYLKNKQRNLNLFNYYYWSNIWTINPDEAKNSILNLIQSDLSKQVVNNTLEIALDVLINETKASKGGFNKIPQLSTEAKGKFQELSFLREQKPEYWEKLVKYLGIGNTEWSERQDNKPKFIIDIEKEFGITLNQVERQEDLFNSISYFLDNEENLIGLNLSNCSIEKVDFLSSFKDLKILVLNDNLIQNIKPLKYFIEQNIAIKLNNQFTGNGIYLLNCNITSPPQEIIEQGSSSILAYWNALEQQGTVTNLNSGRIIIVGDGGVGKGILFHRLLSNDVKNDKTTNIINSSEIVLKNTNGSDINLSVWEFGEQAIHYTLDEFFFDNQALYILVLSSRMFDDNFHKWIHKINTFRNNKKTPNIIIVNNTIKYEKPLDLSKVKKQYPNIKEVLNLNLKDDSIFPLTQIIINNLYNQIIHVPKRWEDIHRNIISLKKEKINYISWSKFINICNKYDLNNNVDQQTLSNYFNQTGVIFQHTNDIVLLNSFLIEKGIIQLFKNKIVKRQNGLFSIQDTDEIWHNYTKDEKNHFLHLIENPKFSLGFKTNQNYILPKLLKVEQPKYYWNSKGTLRLRIQYNQYYSERIFHRLMGRFSDNFRGIIWYNGFITEKHGCVAQITQKKIDYESGHIDIEVSGKANNKQYLLKEIKERIDYITKKYFNDIDYDEWTPCLCTLCRNSEKPNLFSKDYLINKKNQDVSKIECRDSYQLISINLLLADREVDSNISDLENYLNIQLKEIHFKDLGHPNSKANYSLNSKNELNGLSIRSQELKNIDILNDRYYENIRKLYLGGNKITDFKVISNLKNLIDLGLNHNQITYFPSTLLNDLPNLKRIYLKGNPVENLPEYLIKTDENILSDIENINIFSQLRLFGIRGNTEVIFTNTEEPLSNVVCNYLERAGIKTASDFIDINSEGKVKKSKSSQYIKIPFLTPERGFQLKSWFSDIKTQLKKSKKTPAEIIIDFCIKEKSTTLNLGNLGLTELPNNLFKCVWLEHLSLGNWFYDKKNNNWVSLNYSKDQVNTLISLKGIEGLKNIKILSLHNNKITDLTPISILGKLEILDCNSNDIKNIISLNSNTNLRVLSLWGNKLKNIKPILRLEKLERLNVSDNEIEHINHINKLPKLQQLQISRNYIRDLRWISYLPQLTELSCEDNLIKHLELRTIKKLRNLKTLELKGNPFQIPFEQLSSSDNDGLKTINKIYNNLLAKKLRSFNIRENATSIFSATDSKPLIRVICDYLERSKIFTAADFTDANINGEIKRLDSDEFEKVPFLDKRGIYLKAWRENLIQEIIECENKVNNSINQCIQTKSKTLDLGNLALLELPQKLFECTWVEHLNLGNYIYDIETKKWNKILRTGELNRLTNLNGIESLENLKILSLHNNNITDLAPIGKLKQLEVLNCYSNNISNLSPISINGNLTTLVLWNNQIQDISPIKKLEKLEKLSFAENIVENITSVEKLKKLNYLYFSSNKVKDISPIITLPNLKELRCEDNNISFLSKNLLDKLTQISTFINSNPIKNLPLNVYENRTMNYNNLKSYLSGDKKCILLIDSEKDIHENIEFTFGKIYDIIHVYSEIDLWSVIESSFRINLIVINLYLNEVQRIINISQLKQYYDIPILGITQSSRTEDVVEAMKNGAEYIFNLGDYDVRIWRNKIEELISNSKYIEITGLETLLGKAKNLESNPSDFEYCKNELIDLVNQNKISKEKQLILYPLLFNFANRQSVKGNNTYLLDNIDYFIYLGFDKQILYTNNRIPIYIYTNFLSLIAANHEIKEIKKYAYKYLKDVEDKEVKKAEYFTDIFIAFYSKDYQRVVDIIHLNEKNVVIGFEFSLKVRVWRFLICSYYELKYEDALLNALQSYRRYIKGRQIPEDKKNMDYKLIYYIRKIYRCKTLTTLKKIETEFLQEKSIIYKNWLEEKIKEAYNEITLNNDNLK